MRLALIIVTAFMLMAARAHAQLPFSSPNADALLKSMQARIDELRDPKANIPDNSTLLDREYNRTDQEIERYSGFANMTPPGNEVIGEISDIEAALGKFSQGVLALNCDQQATEYGKLYDDFVATEYKLQAVITKIGAYNYPGIDLHAFFDLIFSDPPEDDAQRTSYCKESQVQVRNAGMMSTITQSLDQLKSRIGDNIKRSGDMKTMSETLLNLLRQRRAAVQEKIVASSPQQQVTSYLWIIMIEIGASSVLTMLVIRLFAHDIQMEWVASGQVIQFVTVMILLSVIMALGLSGILKENTLGTLLGGLAGYILAQGVGRAAARDAVRRTGGTPNAPPAPPPAPPARPAPPAPPARPPAA